MKRRVMEALIIAGLAMCASVLRAQTPLVGKILIGTGKTYVLDSPIDIERISIASPEVAESVPVSNRTVMINGRSVGDTTAIVWLSDGTRKQYDVTVMFAAARLDAAKEQLEKEFEGRVQLTGDSTAIYLTGTVKNMFASVRAEAIASTIGKVVNLLKVEIPPQEQQILLKVKFADVDRSKSFTLGGNILGAPGGFPFNVTTGGSSPSRFSDITTTPGGVSSKFTLSDTLNLLMFDPHANLLATLQALQGQNVLQILEEPNLLALNGREASFLAGGEFPFPNLQGGGSGVGQVTVSFREFGIKLKFTPTITPRGTIRIKLSPEVSSLDFADALTVSGGTVPALTTRRIDTEVELEDGQSFAIAGLLNRTTTEALQKIPGLGDIPILGKFFSTKTTNRTNSELIVIVTPELVYPMAKDQPAPQLIQPRTYLDAPDSPEVLRTPGKDKTGLTINTTPGEISVQEMDKIQRERAREGSTAGASLSTTGAPPVIPAVIGVPMQPQAGASVPSQ